MTTTELTDQARSRIAIPSSLWRSRMASTCCHLLEWRDLSERDQLWAAFATDPDWLAGRARSEENGPLVERIENMLLSPTAYSPIR